MNKKITGGRCSRTKWRQAQEALGSEAGAAVGFVRIILDRAFRIGWHGLKFCERVRSDAGGAWSYGFAIALLFLSAGQTVTGQRYQTDWEPNRYRVECAHGNCLTNSLHSKIVENLEDITAKFKTDGWQAQVKFGPVVGTGANARTIVTDSPENKYAWTNTNLDCKTATVHFGQKTKDIAIRPHWLYYFFAHEMFHVTQRTYPAFNGCNEKSYGWVSESLATAVGLDFARRHPDHQNKFPITDPTGTDVDTMVREILSDSGGREYYLPLNWQDYLPNGKENNTAHVRYYRTSGLWRHIAEVYYGGSYKFVQNYLGRKPINNDWLDWTHKNVYFDSKIQAPLARVYALYMADVANWYRKDRPAMYFKDKETDWHKILYDGCLKYTISPSSPKVRIDVVMQPSSARCIQITAEGLSPGDRKAINAGVFSPQLEINELDALQLSLANSTDSVGLDCSQALRDDDEDTRLRARDKCVFGFAPGVVMINDKPHVGRVWDVVPQETDGGSKITNTYILSRMAPDPTNEPKSRYGKKQLKISAVFILDSPDAKINNKKLGHGPNTIGRFNRSPVNFLPAFSPLEGSTADIFSQKLKPVRIVGHLNGSPANYAQETVPRFGKDGKQAIATVTPGAVTPSVPVFDIFGANPSLSSQGNPASSGGIWMLRFTAVEVEDDGMYQQSLVERDYIAAMPYDSSGKNPRPLQLGDSGEFKAMVSARVGSRNFMTKTPATITLDEYSMFVLSARIEGTLCEVTIRRNSDECVNPQPFSATMIKAFAGFHDANSRFVIEDTPATRQLARAKQALMNEALDQSGTDTPMPPDIEAGPSSEGAVIIGTCTCSCDDRPYLKKLQEYVNKGEKLSSPVMKRLRTMMGCMVTCSAHYRTCNLKPR